MKRKLKKSLSLLLASAMLATAIGSLACSKEPKTDTGKPEPKETGSVTGKPDGNTASLNTDEPTAAPNTTAPTVAPEKTDSPTVFNPYNIGESYVFGAYEQDNDESNGKEPIEWIVLDKDGPSLLIVSKYALDGNLYNTKGDEPITWETCSLRAWLNSEFINEAFSSDERNKIQIAEVKNADNNGYGGTPGGNDTTDNVFLLSLDEAEKYFDSKEARMCAPTDYAVARGAWQSGDYSVGGRASCYYWLRSPGRSYDSAANVECDGSVLDYGHGVDCDYLAVRPVVWVNP